MDETFELTNEVTEPEKLHGQDSIYIVYIEGMRANRERVRVTGAYRDLEDAIVEGKIAIDLDNSGFFQTYTVEEWLPDKRCNYRIRGKQRHFHRSGGEFGGGDE